MSTTTAWQSTNGSTAMERVPLGRRELRDDDVAVRIDYCGVCHSDLHQIHRSTDGSLVPGHEFVGTVTAVGSAASRFAVGDRVAVGTLVDSCGECGMCEAGQEIYCAEVTLTYNGTDRQDGSRTFGGYSRDYVVREGFAYPLPDGLDPAAAAPLMCAGITVWEPLSVAGVGPGSKVAVAGLGGLGHLAVKMAAALGAEVTVLSRTADKAEEARGFGAAGLLLTTDEAAMKEAAGRFDLIVDTISTDHDLRPYLGLLGLDGTLSVLGMFGEIPAAVMDLMWGRKSITASGTGGRPGTQAMLEFCAANDITAQIELLPSARVGEALDRLEEGDVRYRFVLDLADLD
jgi:alcohol dehydrogenase (NADP+)